MADELLKFQAYGTSRCPLIRDGETVLVRPREYREYRPGDFILYRCLQGNTAAVIFGQKMKPLQVIGLIEAIERNGRRIKVGRWPAGLRRYLGWLALPGRLAEKITNRLFRSMQRSRLYRKMTRSFFGGGTAYETVEGREAQISGIIHCRGQSFLDRRFYGAPQGFQQRHIVAKRQGRIIGRLCANGYSPDLQGTFNSGWWIYGCYTRPAWRGLGICEGLLAKTFEVLRQDKITAVYLTVRADNRPAVRLYEKTGFVRVEIPELEKKLADEAASGQPRRIMMERKVK